MREVSRDLNALRADCADRERNLPSPVTLAAKGGRRGHTRFVRWGANNASASNANPERGDLTGSNVEGRH